MPGKFDKKWDKQYGILETLLTVFFTVSSSIIVPLGSRRWKIQIWKDPRRYHDSLILSRLVTYLENKTYFNLKFWWTRKKLRLDHFLLPLPMSQERDTHVEGLRSYTDPYTLLTGKRGAESVLHHPIGNSLHNSLSLWGGGGESFVSLLEHLPQSYFHLART